MRVNPFPQSEGIDALSRADTDHGRVGSVDQARTAIEQLHNG
jgi:hypothetical protein